MNLSLEQLKLLDFMCTRDGPWTAVSGAPIESLERLALVERHPLPHPGYPAVVRWRPTVLGIQTWNDHPTLAEHAHLRALGKRSGMFYVWAAYAVSLDTLTSKPEGGRFETGTVA